MSFDGYKSASCNGPPNWEYEPLIFLPSFAKTPSKFNNSRAPKLTTNFTLSPATSNLETVGSLFNFAELPM